MFIYKDINPDNNTTLYFEHCEPDGNKVFCKLTKLRHYNVLKVDFCTAFNSFIQDSYAADEILSYIDKFKPLVDEFYLLLKNHLVIDLDYDRIIVSNFGVLNEYIKNKYNLNQGE